jgi:hypothetical protein
MREWRYYRNGSELEMEKRKPPFKVSEAESSRAILKSSEHSPNETLGLVAVPEAESEKCLLKTSTDKGSVTSEAIEPDDPERVPAPSVNILPKHHGLIRHNAIVGGCVLTAALLFALSSFDFSSLIKRKAIIDNTGALIYASPLPKLPIGFQYGRFSNESEGLRLIETEGSPRLEGFVDDTGKIVIEPRFHWARSFHEGLARASESRSQGFIDSSGRFVIAPQFSHVESFEHGTALVNHNGQWRVIDRLGKFKGDSFEEKPYRDGDLFIVKAHGKFGLLSSAGETLLASNYDSIVPLDGRDSVASRRVNIVFKNLKPAAYFEVRLAGLSGVIDRKGKIVLEPKYDSIQSYSNGFAVIGNQVCSELIDPAGISLASYSELTNWDKLIAAKEKGKWVFLNEKGEKLTLPPVDSVVLSPNGKWFSNGLAPVRLNGKWGFVDRKGRFAIKPQFEFVSGFEHGVCPIWDGATWKLIDRSGAYLPLPKLGSIERENDGLLRVDVAGPLYQFGKTETISQTRNRIDGINNGLMAGLTLANVFQHMWTITDATGMDYEGDY